MSWFDETMKKPLQAIALLIMAIMLAACQVQPLYKGGDGSHDQSINMEPVLREKMQMIAIDAPHDRMAQLVYNHLIFLIGGGRGNTTTPQYQLSLNVTFSIQNAVQVDIGDYSDRTGRSSAGRVVVDGGYSLRTLEERPVANARRSIAVSYDRPRQEYATLSAEEDAKERAAIELAEQLYLALAQQMSKL